MNGISVAMAVYNGEKHLPEQLDSILSQLLPEDEIVISYDPSTDGTLELLQRYRQREPRLKVIQDPGKGINSNFNNAIANCTGDYIFISDQDDRWAENKRARVMQAFSETGADMVIHNGVHTDARMQPVSEPFFSIYRIGDGKFRNFLKPRYSGCCMAFTRKMAEKIIPIPARIGAYDHWLGMVGECLGRIAYVEDILLYHRLHDSNVTPTSHRALPVILKSRMELLTDLIKRIRTERKR